MKKCCVLAALCAVQKGGDNLMLAVEKELLLASTSKEVSHLRNVELQYYLEHTSSIQTMATLLAGFAFTAFVSMDTVALSIDNVRFERPTGDYDATSVNGTQDFSVTAIVERLCVAVMPASD